MNDAASDRNQKLTLGAKWSYAVGEMGPGLIENAISFFLLFYYTDIVQLDPRLAGIALMVGRGWDAITDPMMGYISDHTRSRWGRRRPYLIYGALPYGLLFFMLWAPFLGVTGNAAFPLLLFGFLAYSTAATVCQVPFYTLGGELSTDYHERSSVIGIRQVFATLGILVGGALTPLFVGFFTDAGYETAESRPAWLTLLAIYGGIAAVCWLISGFRSREREHTGTGEDLGSLWAVPRGAIKALMGTLRNPLFRVMAGVFVIVQVAFTMTTATLVYLLKYWVGDAGAFKTIMVTLILVMLPFLGFWVRVSRRIGKRASYLMGLAILGIFQFQSLWMFGPDKWTGWYYIYPAGFAIGLASHFVFPWALMPDIIDYDELETGKRQDGPYFGVMTFLRKSSSALSSALAGFMLSAIGYNATLADQAPNTLLGIRIIYGVIPGVAFLCGMALFLRFPLTQERSREIRADLEKRHAAERAAGS